MWNVQLVRTVLAKRKLESLISTKRFHQINHQFIPMLKCAIEVLNIIIIITIVFIILIIIIIIIIITQKGI